tara:strand:+ start:150 stop:869 length:720 start_codon:yes stop_codon:yes gene_type:complete
MKLKYTIPETKADITVKTYLKIRKLYKNAELMEIDVDEKELVSVVLDVPLELINKIPQKEYNEALNNITNALNQDAKLYLTFNLKGVKYGFLNDMDNMSTAEYSALDGFSKDVDANCYSILNALYRPVINERFYKSWFGKSKKGKYTIESYSHNNDITIFKDAPYEIYESALVFFFNLGKDLVNSTQNYMSQAEQRQTIEVSDLPINGDGIRRMIHLLKQSALELTKSESTLLVEYSKD